MVGLHLLHSLGRGYCCLLRQSCLSEITLIEQKSKKPKTIALNKTVISALASYFPNTTPNTALILNDRTNKSITRTQAHRIISTAAKEANITHKVSCHSLRKTFGYHAWQSGISPAVIMDIYNHSSMDITKRYLGVSQDDKNKVYLNLNFTKPKLMSIPNKILPN